MKKLILTVAMFCTTALNAQMTHLNGFEKNKHGYTKTFFTMEEAIQVYSYVMDKNGVDTLNSQSIPSICLAHGNELIVKNSSKKLRVISTLNKVTHIVTNSNFTLFNRK